MRKRTPVSIEQYVGWAKELVWMFWRRKKSVVRTWIRTLDRPARSLVFMPLTHENITPQEKMLELLSVLRNFRKISKSDY